jgi:endonuclease G, mitochondrial
MKNLYIFIFSTVILCGLVFTPVSPFTGDMNPPEQDSLYKLLYKFEIPKYFKKDKDNIVQHIAYTLLYDEEHEQAKWVAYELTREETIPLVQRKNKFITDPLVKTGSAEDSDYKNSGYSRGHLAPCADMTFSDTTMKESFYFSNMSPQLQGFNAGIWSSLESQVRKWAVENNSIYVVTGPVLHDSLPKIGNNGVSVPDQFYKVILHYSDSSQKAIGFLMSQSSKGKLKSFAVPVDSIEKITKINFFPLLPDSKERKLEREIKLSEWGLW